MRAALVFAREGAGIVTAEPSIADAMRAVVRQQQIDSEDIKIVKHGELVYVTASVPRSYKDYAKVAFCHDLEPQPSFVQARCTCLKGKRLAICCHILSLMFRYWELHTRPISSTDGPRTWGRSGRPTKKRDGRDVPLLAADAFVLTRSPDKPDIVGVARCRAYDKCAQLKLVQAYTKEAEKMRELADEPRCKRACDLLHALGGRPTPTSQC